MKSSCSFLLLLLFSAHAGWTQDAQPAPPSTTQPAANQSGRRPTIGLVLEGGGALGLAHVGVLRWFEENHIPVDYVAGTSMGALVGSLYATGMSGHQIDEFLKGVNWNRSLRSELPYSARSFRRKEDKRDYPNDLEFGLRSGVVFPGGFEKDAFAATGAHAKRLPAELTPHYSLFINLEPLVGASLGALTFGDPFGGPQALGAAAILAGIVLSLDRGGHEPALLGSAAGG